MDRPSSDAHEIALAAQALARGELVAFPTETVYGLGADAENADAVGRIYTAKGRPANHPIIVHVAPGADLEYWSGPLAPLVRRLVDAFWPGPLSLILPRLPNVAEAVSGGQDSVGLRCPSHPVAQALLRDFAALKPGGHGGVAAPSANQFGHVSPTQAGHVRAEFPALVAGGMAVLEGGAAEVGIESTILDVSRLEQGVGPVLLRPGHVSAADIAEAIGVMPSSPDAAAPRASGTLKAHYAPRTALRTVSTAALPALAAGRGLPDQAGMVAVVSHSLAQPPAGTDARIAWHAAPSEARAYARDLYALLRHLDTQGYGLIVLEDLPASDAWQAVRDRVGRAAAAFQGGQPG